MGERTLVSQAPSPRLTEIEMQKALSRRTSCWPGDTEQSFTWLSRTPLPRYHLIWLRNRLKTKVFFVTACLVLASTSMGTAVAQKFTVHSRIKTSPAGYTKVVLWQQQSEFPGAAFSLVSSSSEIVKFLSPVYYCTQAKDSVLASPSLSTSTAHKTSVTLLARGGVWDSKHFICLLSLPTPVSPSLQGQWRQE